jgi:hypothetical protein
MHYLTTDFLTNTEYDSKEAALEAARSLWLDGAAICIWVFDAEHNRVALIRSSLDIGV